MAEFETRSIHEGCDHREDTGAVIPPVFLTSTFEHGSPGGFDYTRSGNPNFDNLGRMLAGLENAGHATVFASGVSAITAVVSTLKQGDTVLAEENIYGCTFRLFAQVFAKFGIEIIYTDFTDPANDSLIAEHRPALVWIESPTNPLLKIIDIERVAKAARAVDVATVVDNTFAGSYLQNPLQLGATLSLLSTTKYTNGHSDVLGGVVCCNEPEWHDKMVFAQKALGLHPSPFDCWLISRGAKTQALRMDRHCENALILSGWLEQRLQPGQVRYPFLTSHPQYDLARRQMRGGSGIFTADFQLDLDETLSRLKQLRYFTLAESLGGIESLVCHPASMTHASVPKETRLAVGISDSLVRFSTGIEHPDDLKRDLEKMLL